MSLSHFWHKQLEGWSCVYWAEKTGGGERLQGCGDQGVRAEGWV